MYKIKKAVERLEDNVESPHALYQNGYSEAIFDATQEIIRHEKAYFNKVLDFVESLPLITEDYDRGNLFEKFKDSL